MDRMKAEDFISYFSSNGFHYNKDLIFNYYNSLVAKPFVILTGISGSGKSKIAELFANAIGCEEENCYELIPVKPNWRDSKGLFGYHNLIDGGYYITPLIRLFIRAINNPDVPHFLILDEMNLAKTEHYFADYLSLIESRRGVTTILNPSCNYTNFSRVFEFPEEVKLSEAIILSAIDINRMSNQSSDDNLQLEIRDYRENRFSKLWKEKKYNGNPENWTPQYRTELNQGEGRLAHRVFERISNGVYKFKNKDEMTVSDRNIVEKLEKLYEETFGTLVQKNFVLHNSDKCLGANGQKCECEECPYCNSEKYKCEKLYNAESETYLVPPEMPIPVNVFTIGTVNVDETTYMFSPKVLDRSNVIEFNEVDFAGLYGLSQEQKDKIDSVSRTVIDNDFYFDTNSDVPELRIVIPAKEYVESFKDFAPEQFDCLMDLFVALKKYNLHFGYRVLNEIGAYMCSVNRNTSYDKKNYRAFDNQILQKILPKLYGSFDKIWAPLVEVLGLMLKKPSQLNSENKDALIEELSRLTDEKILSLDFDGKTADECFNYPKSAVKISDMLLDLSSSGFATFIK
ncbi:MAG: hypothetical protein ACI4HO_01255 [Ruminococcus sp.]